MNFCIILFALVILTGINCGNRDGPDRHVLEEKFYWDIPVFEIPADRREQAIASGSYIPNKNGIYSLGIWRDKMFVSVYRFTNGVASALNYFSLNTTDKSPVLIPYPSFEANYVNEDPNNQTVSLPSPWSVINTAHFEIDKCNRLWIADSGFTDYFGQTRIITPQAIVIFDLITDTLIRRREVHHKYVGRISTLPDIVIDIEGDNCEDVHAYISDGFGSIIVYSFKKDRMWVVEHSFMQSNPNEKHFVLEHIEHDWDYGIFALAIADQQSDGSKRIYFAPLASTNIYYVSNRVLQDESYDITRYDNDFHLLGGTGRYGNTNTMLYYQKTGVLFSTLFGGATVGCWNTRLPFQSMHTVHKTRSGIEFYPTDLDIDDNGNIWVLSFLTPVLVYEELPMGRKNMKIYKESVENVIAGTNCKAKSKKLH